MTPPTIVVGCDSSNPLPVNLVMRRYYGHCHKDPYTQPAQVCWLGRTAHTIRDRVPRALKTPTLTLANIIARRLGEKRKDEEHKKI